MLRFFSKSPDRNPAHRPHHRRDRRRLRRDGGPAQHAGRAQARCRNGARRAWSRPTANQGGHRERAIGFVDSAIAETQAGIAYAR